MEFERMIFAKISGNILGRSACVVARPLDAERSAGSRSAGPDRLSRRVPIVPQPLRDC